MPRRRTRLTKDEAELLYEKLSASRPDPKTELNYSSPFTLLVAVVLSAQATDVGVNKATPGLFALADTPETMAQLTPDQVAEKIRTIGLYRGKAKNVVALSKMLVEQHGGQVPRDREALEALPGVGRKTANVILMEIFGEGAIAVDTHVFRVSNRTGLAPGRTPAEVEMKLMAVTPQRFLHGAHHWLILHGRYVCKARRPECWRCVVNDICLYPDKTPAPGSVDDSAGVGPSVTPKPKPKTARRARR